jgi:hypothetical protein
MAVVVHVVPPIAGAGTCRSAQDANFPLPERPMRMPSPSKDPQALWQHVSGTYVSLRLGLALLAFAFPPALYLVGRWVHDLPLQQSMSAYFFAATEDQCAEFPMRTVFVGFLFVIGVGLYLYRGVTRLENGLLNAAGACAVLVAVFPERNSAQELTTDPHLAALALACPAVADWARQPPGLPIHYLAAVALFMLLAVVAWRCAGDTLPYLPAAGTGAETYRLGYRILALLMLLCPAIGLAVAALLDRPGSTVFFIEAAGIWIFGSYWAVKTRELATSGLEHTLARHGVA